MGAVIGAYIDEQIGSLGWQRDERLVGLLHFNIMSDDGHRIVPVEPEVFAAQRHQYGFAAKDNLPMSASALIGAVSEDLREALME